LFELNDYDWKGRQAQEYQEGGKDEEDEVGRKVMCWGKLAKNRKEEECDSARVAGEQRRENRRICSRIPYMVGVSL
jgi:hypothetical protein